MPIGKIFPHYVRALRILTEELLRPLIVDDKILEEILKELIAKSKTSKLWVDILVTGF